MQSNVIDKATLGDRLAQKPENFAQNVDESALLVRLRRQYEEAQSYWEGGNKSKRKLSEARKRNYNWWVGNHYEGVTLYEHNIPYQNNRIYVSIESSLSIAVARIAQPQVMPSSEKETSRQFAADTEKSIYRIAQKRKLKKKMKTAARNLLTKYVGIIEPFWNPKLGRDGDVDYRVVDPEDVTISNSSGLFDEPPMISVKRWCTAAQMVDKFPHREQEIKQRFNLTEGNALLEDSEQRCYQEVWFDDWDDDGNEVVRVLFALGEGMDSVLGVIDNPYWLEEDDEDGIRNYFDRQRKPFIFINHQNSGKEKIDDNASIDQQIPLNRVLNKRGRQITENADEASGGIVYNSKMISKADMSKLIGAPDEKIGVNGDVRIALTRVASPLLPEYVINDKMDARSQIDEMGATNSVTRDGNKSKYNTLGEAVLQKQDDYSRQDSLSESIEDAYLECYEWTLQIMKVFYTEAKMIQVRGDDGQFDQVMMQSDKIEDGIDIDVGVGSTAPLNKEQNRQDADKLAQHQWIDPLTYIEVLQTGMMPSPQRVFERLMKWMTDKGRYMQQAMDDEIDRNAQVDIELINRGVQPEMREEITAEYLDTLIKNITSGKFMDLPQETQMAHRNWLDQSKQKAAELLKMRESLIATAQIALAPPPGQGLPPGAPPADLMPSLQAAGLVDQNGLPSTQGITSGSGMPPQGMVQ